MATLLERVARLPADKRAIVMAQCKEEIARLGYDWYGELARDDQCPPEGDWETWLVAGGRGSGKTRTGAEYIRWCVEEGHAKRIAVAGPTAGDIRDVMIEEGPSSILKTARPDFMPRYEPSKLRLTWPNGAVGIVLSADEPERFRGKQFELAWADEVAAWKYAESWHQLQFGLRLGKCPRVVATSTPKPTAMFREIYNDPMTIVTHATMYDNRANLSPRIIEKLERRYKGSRLGDQELYGKLLSDIKGALWGLDQHIVPYRVRLDEVPELVKVTIGVDPAATETKERGAETGIVAAGRAANGHIYVLQDWTTDEGPEGWATAAVDAYHDHEADVIIAEKNQGGAMVRHTIRTVNRQVPIRTVHATRGKRTRAEPVVSLYEQGKVHHVGVHDLLEDQMCSWIPGKPSPDRMDALVWAITDLISGKGKQRVRSRVIGGRPDTVDEEHQAAHRRRRRMYRKRRQVFDPQEDGFDAGCILHE